MDWIRIFGIACLVLGACGGQDDSAPADPACVDVSCDEGQVCLAGGCLAVEGEPCLTVGCDQGLLCHEGLCQDSACVGPEDCPEKHNCLNFACVPVDMTGRSEYSIAVTTWDGTEYSWEADLTDKLEYFSFGSAHIGTAVALAVSHTMISPAYRIVTLDFGKVVGSDQFPIQCDAPGQYLFGCDEAICGTSCEFSVDLVDTAACEACVCSPEDLWIGLPPGMEMNIEGVQYKSSTPGATGSVVVSQWGNQTGQVMAGSFSGRLLQDPTKGNRGTCAGGEEPCYGDADCGGAADSCEGLKLPLHLDVEGDFYFTLPQKDTPH